MTETETLFAKALDCDRADDHAGALLCYATILEQEPASFRALIGMAWSYLFQPRPREALRRVRSALALATTATEAEDFAEARWLAAQALLELRRPRFALRQLRLALRFRLSRDQRLNILLDVGKAYSLTGRERRAVLVYEALLAAGDPEPSIVRFLARSTYRLAFRNRAFRLYREAIDLEPESADKHEICIEFVQALVADGRVDAALQLSHRELIRFESAGLWAEVASIHADREEFEKACAAARAALRLDPAHRASLSLLNRCETASSAEGIQPAL